MALAIFTFATAQEMADYITAETSKWPACGDINNTGITFVNWTNNTLQQHVFTGEYYDA